MKNQHRVFSTLALALAVVAALDAAPVLAQAPESPSDTVEAFHKALKIGDGKAALAFMARDVTVFEQGFVENSRDDWGKNQLAEANKFAAQTDRRVLRREAQQDTQTASVISTTLTTGQFGNRKLDLEGTETMLLRRDGETWKISHIHWSAHPKTADAPDK